MVEGMFSKHRLEALSDGIFAIVMTLLVLDLKVPEGVLPQHFASALAQQWVSFLITFTIAAIFWTMQHRVFALVDDIHQKTLIPTFIFLGFVSVLPFSTSLLGHRLREPMSFLVYYANQFLIATSLAVKMEVAMRQGAVTPSKESRLLRLRLYSMAGVMAAGAVGASFLPIQWIWVPPLVLGLLAKRFRAYKEARMSEAQPGFN